MTSKKSTTRRKREADYLEVLAKGREHHKSATLKGVQLIN